MSTTCYWTTSRSCILLKRPPIFRQRPYSAIISLRTYGSKYSASGHWHTWALPTIFGSTKGLTTSRYKCAKISKVRVCNFARPPRNTWHYLYRLTIPFPPDFLTNSFGKTCPTMYQTSTAYEFTSLRWINGQSGVFVPLSIRILGTTTSFPLDYSTFSTSSGSNSWERYPNLWAIASAPSFTIYSQDPSGSKGKQSRLVLEPLPILFPVWVFRKVSGAWSGPIN